MKVITLLNEKGGVGKTTLATHIAAELAIQGKRVVLIDGDQQANATMSFRIDPSPALYEWMLREHITAKDVVKLVHPTVYAPGSAPERVKGSLFVVASNAEARNIPTSIGDPRVFYAKVQQLKTVVDYVIVDTSPTANLFHTAIYIATDAIVYPTQLEQWSLAGLWNAYQRLESANQFRAGGNMAPIAVLGIVPMMTNLRTINHQMNHNKVMETFGELVTPSIAKRAAWSDAPSAGITLQAYEPDGKAMEDFQTVMNVLMERVPDEQ
ncbi:MAG: ParA family protein [Chloroflexota bacterium]